MFLHAVYIYLYFLLDVKAMKGFGKDDQLIFLSVVECNGSEEMFTMCSGHKPDDHSCSQGNIVGVTCGRSTSEA